MFTKKLKIFLLILTISLLGICIYQEYQIIALRNLVIDIDPIKDWELNLVNTYLIEQNQKSITKQTARNLYNLQRYENKQDGTIRNLWQMLVDYANNPNPNELGFEIIFYDQETFEIKSENWLIKN